VSAAPFDAAPRRLRRLAVISSVGVIVAGLFAVASPAQAAVAKPSASNTGVPAGTTLTTYTGPLTITVDGTVIDKKAVYGDLKIAARNVVVRNSYLHCGTNKDLLLFSWAVRECRAQAAAGEHGHGDEGFGCVESVGAFGQCS
jgi:hypothetical protein